MENQEKFYDYLLKLNYELITIEGYKKILNRFFRELETEIPTKEQAENYLIEMRKKDYSYSHIRNSITIIKNYMKFIGRPIEIEHPRKPISLPTKEILTEGEIARMMAACKNIREEAMLGILAYCGLRNKEVCNLKIKDIDFENNCIRVIGGKFRKDRIVPLNKELYKILIEYLKEKDTKWVFVTLIEQKQYNGWALRKRIKVIAKQAKVKKRVYPHLLRHSIITHLLERGANVIAVQQFAGHSDIKTTMRYTHFSPRKIYQEYLYYVPSYI